MIRPRLEGSDENSSMRSAARSDSRRTTWFRTLIGMLAIAATTTASAAEPSSADVLKAMHRRVASLKVTAGAESAAPVKLVETPLLPYSNPGGLTVTTDGARLGLGNHRPPQGPHRHLLRNSSPTTPAPSGAQN